MRRVIVDYKKLTNEILSMLVEKYPDGYGDDDIIRFKNANNESIDAVEVRTEDTVYLVKVSTRLANTMEKFEDEDEEDFVAEELADDLDIPQDEDQDQDQEEE